MRHPASIPVLLLALATLLAVPVAAAAQQQAALRVVAREDGTGRAVQGVQVTVGGAGRVAVSDSAGVAYSPSVPLGQRLLRVERVGYQPEHIAVEFQPGGTVEVEVDLLRAPVELEGITVTQRSHRRGLHESGFLQRQRLGLGQFVDRADIERRRPEKMSALFRGIHGMQVRYCKPPECMQSGYVLSHNLAGVSLESECKVRIYMDGIQVDGENIDQWSINRIEGVEVYRRGAGVPPQFGGTGASCGVVLIWTRVET